jgi:hypothetical protein
MVDGFYDEYQNELFEELMVQYDIQQERQELLAVEEEEDFYPAAGRLY